MTILKDLSVLWSLVHVLIMFILLFESRFPWKKALKLTLAGAIPLLAANFLLYLLVGNFAYVLLLFTCVLPSLVFLWFLAKYRDGRFLFTFCLSDTLWLEIMYVTNILDFYFGNQYIFMFVSRLILYPLLEWFLWKKVRPIYFEVQRTVTRGWYIFATISAIFYVMMLLSMSWPTMIMTRPEYLPAFVLQLILMPVFYIHIFSTLQRQQQLYDTQQLENILQVQVTSLRSRINEFSTANERFQEERHDFRHKMRTIAALAEKGDLEAIEQTAKEYVETLPEHSLQRYCNHRILDAVLASYLEWAKRKGIRVTAKLIFPDVLPVNEAELATALANAIENAIQACEKIEMSKRYIEIKTIIEPCFMLQVRNSFDGVVGFDEEGIPIAVKKGHGFGTRSIVTFCEKNNAFCTFAAEGKEFTLRIVFS